MKSPRDLSGRELADGLCRHWDYLEVHQTGSHIILQTETPSINEFRFLRTNHSSGNTERDSETCRKSQRRSARRDLEVVGIAPACRAGTVYNAPPKSATMERRGNPVRYQSFRKTG